MRSRKMRSRRLPPSDKISNLPDSLIESILMYLPTQDAARTSMLSTRWKYAWTRLPQLIIGPIKVKCNPRTILSSILRQFALLHQGPIKKFCISDFKLDCPELENLFSLLSKKGVEDIKLSISCTPFYKLPLPFFACKQLKHLNLEGCKFDTTVEDFSGFSSLVSLRLHSFIVCRQVLESFISNCPLLEQLCLDNIHSVARIDIDAPMLKSFISMGLQVITFRNTPLLSSVSIGGSWFRFNLDMLVDLPILHKLHISRAWKDVNVPVNPRSIFLQDVSLSEFTLDVLELSSLLWLIKSSPNLKHMSIQFLGVKKSTTNDVLRILKEQDSSQIMLDELEELKLKRVHGMRSELEFIKFLLSKSTRLKKIIVDDTLEGVRKILEKYLKVPIGRESKKSPIVLMGAHSNLGW